MVCDNGLTSGEPVIATSQLELFPLASSTTPTSLPEGGSEGGSEAGSEGGFSNPKSCAFSNVAFSWMTLKIYFYRRQSLTMTRRRHDTLCYTGPAHAVHYQRFDIFNNKKKRLLTIRSMSHYIYTLLRKHTKL